MRTENGRRALVSLLGHAMPLKTKQTKEERARSAKEAAEARNARRRFRITFERCEASAVPHTTIPDSITKEGTARAAYVLWLKDSYFRVLLGKSSDKTVRRRIPHPTDLRAHITAVCTEITGQD